MSKPNPHEPNKEDLDELAAEIEIKIKSNPNFIENSKSIQESMDKFISSKIKPIKFSFENLPNFHSMKVYYPTCGIDIKCAPNYYNIVVNEKTDNRFNTVDGVTYPAPKESISNHISNRESQAETQVSKPETIIQKRSTHNHHSTNHSGHQTTGHKTTGHKTTGQHISHHAHDHTKHSVRHSDDKKSAHKHISKDKSHKTVSSKSHSTRSSHNHKSSKRDSLEELSKIYKGNK